MRLPLHLGLCLLLIAPVILTSCDNNSAADADAADAAPSQTDAEVVATCMGLAAASPGVTTRSIMVDGVMRSYELSIPNGYQADSRARLVFGWHGLGGNGALLRSYTQVEGVAQQDPGAATIFVYPDGLYLDAFGGTGWVLADTNFYDAILAQLTAELCIDATRIFSYGHSFGGYFSNTMGCMRGDSMRAIAPVAGGWPPGMGECRPSVSAWLSHAQDDAVVAIGLGREARDAWLTENQCGAATTSIEPSPCVEYQECQSGKNVVWCETPSGGHAWPSYGGDAIWAFFASF